MRKQTLRILITLIAVAGFSLAAKAQAPDSIAFKISHEFVVAGKALPAGTYRVNRLSANNPVILTLSNFERRVSLNVLATDIESNRTNKAEVSFELVRGEYLLSKFATTDHSFAIPISNADVLEAQAGSRGGTYTAGGSARSR